MIFIKKIINSIGLNASHFVLTILIFLLISLGFAITFRDFFEFNNLKETVESVPIDKVIGNKEPKIYEYLSKIGLSKEKIYTFLDKIKFKKILSENLSSKILNKIRSFEIRFPNEDEITDFLYDNLEYLKKIFVFETSREDVKNFVHKHYTLFNSLVENISDNVDLSGLDELKALPKLIKNWTIRVLEVGIIICIILIIVFRLSLYKWLMWVHTSFIFVGLIFALIGIFGNKLFVFLASKLRIVFLIDPFVTFFTKRFIKYGIILMVVSLIAFVLHYLIKYFLKKQKSNKEVRRNLSEA